MPDGFSNTRSLTVEWGHCDPAGIVFNPRFFEFFDHSTASLFETALGMGKSRMMEVYGVAGIPVVETRAAFRAPVRFGDKVEIATSVVELGRSSVRLRHVLTHEGRTCVEGEETRVWTGRDPDDPSRLRAQPMPDEVRSRLASAARDQVG